MGMKNLLAENMFRFVLYLVVAAFLTVANTGCDLWNDDDDDTSAAGAINTPTTAAPPATTAEAPTTTTASLSGTGIVWKPVSDSDHNLVILIPSTYSSSTGVAILSPDGDVIENGRYVGRTNGNRPTYRFTKPGRSYPNGSLLRVGSRTFLVSNTASRYN